MTFWIKGDNLKNNGLKENSVGNFLYFLANILEFNLFQSIKKPSINF